MGMSVSDSTKHLIVVRRIRLQTASKRVTTLIERAEAIDGIRVVSLRGIEDNSLRASKYDLGNHCEFHHDGSIH